MKCKGFIELAVFFISILLFNNCCNSTNLSEIDNRFKNSLTTSERNLLKKGIATFPSACCTNKTILLDRSCPLRSLSIEYLVYRITLSDNLEELKRNYFKRYITRTVINFDTNGFPTIGPSNAPINIIMFYDYTCPHCRRAFPIVTQKVEEFPKKLSFTAMFYPLLMNEEHIFPLKVALSFYRQNKFWEIQNFLFTQNRDLSEEDATKIANEMKLDIEKFKQDLADKTILEKILWSKKQGERAGVEGTPTIFINGYRFNEPLEILDIAIKEEMIRIENKLPKKCNF